MMAYHGDITMSRVGGPMPSDMGRMHVTQMRAQSVIRYGPLQGGLDM